MDYRELLKKYIRAVGDAEGVTFIGNFHDGRIMGAETVFFSEAEIAELRQLEAEGDADRDAE